jgi:hypothetical protein
MLFHLTSSKLLSSFLPTKEDYNADFNIRDYFSELNSSIYPFKTEEKPEKSVNNSEAILYRPPFAVCLHCHAYINHLVQWNKVENSTKYCKWLCSLCNNLNYCESSSFLSSSASSAHPVELSSSSYSCIESQPILSSFLSSQKIIVIGIDLLWMMKEVIGRSEERKEEKRRKVREAILLDREKRKNDEEEDESEGQGNHLKHARDHAKDDEEAVDEDGVFWEILNRSVHSAFTTATCSASSSSSIENSIQFILFFYDSSSIRIVRFNNESSFSSSPVASLSVDIIPFFQLNPVRCSSSSLSSSSLGETTEERETRRNADYYWKDLFQQGLYSLSLSSFLQHADKVTSFLQSWLKSLRRPFLLNSKVGSNNNRDYSPSLEDFASFLNIVQDCYSLVIPIEFFLFTSQSPPLFSSSSSLSQPSPQQGIDRLALAKFYANHLFSSLFLFFLGNDQLALHELIPFLSNASGGKLIICERFQDDSFETNLHSLFSSSFSLVSQMTAGSGSVSGSGSMAAASASMEEFRYFPEAVIEIRCNHNLDLFSLQGPVLSLSQLLEIQSNRSYRDSSSSSASAQQKYSHFSSYKVGSMLFPSSKEEKSLQQEGRSFEGSERSETIHHSSSSSFSSTFPSLFYQTYHLSSAYASYLAYVHEQRVLTETSELIPTSFSIFYDRIKSFYHETPAKERNFQQILFSSSIVVKKEEMEKLFLSASFQLLEQLEGEEGKGINNKKESQSTSFVPQWLSAILPASFTSSVAASVSSTTASSNGSNGKEMQFPTTSSQDDHSIQLFANENEFENSYLSTGIIQITIKSSYYLLQQLQQQQLSSSSSFSSFPGKNHHERITEIKVCTFRLPVSSASSASSISPSCSPSFVSSSSVPPASSSSLSRKEEKKNELSSSSGLNRWELWNWITMRGIVQHYHNELEKQYYSQIPFSSSRKPFSSSRFQKLNEQGLLLFYFFVLFFPVSCRL